MNETCAQCSKPAVKLVREKAPLTGEELVCEQHVEGAVRGELKWLDHSDFELLDV